MARHQKHLGPRNKTPRVYLQHQHEFRAFCEKVYVYQKTYACYDWFPSPIKTYLSNDQIGKQNDQLSAWLVEATSLSERGGRKAAYRFSGIHSAEEFAAVIKCLRYLFGLTLAGKKFPHPIALQFYTFSLEVCHRIACGFDPKKRRWALLNPNQMAFIDDDNEMARAIFNGMEAKQRLAWAGQLYIAAYASPQQARQQTESNLEKIKPFIDYLRHSPEWKNLFDVTAEKANRISDYGVNWKTMARDNGPWHETVQCTALRRKNLVLRHWEPIFLGLCAFWFLGFIGYLMDAYLEGTVGAAMFCIGLRYYMDFSDERGLQKAKEKALLSAQSQIPLAEEEPLLPNTWVSKRIKKTTHHASHISLFSAKHNVKPRPDKSCHTDCVSGSHRRAFLGST
jgi:hypothetical protein